MVAMLGSQVLSVVVQLGCAVALVFVAVTLRHRGGDGWKWLLGAGLGMSLQALLGPLVGAAVMWLPAQAGLPGDVIVYTGIVTVLRSLGWALWWVLLLRGIVLVARPADA
ncbi:MAG: hypothetical protein AAF211_15135 [Myxococcota bacterium]